MNQPSRAANRKSRRSTKDNKNFVELVKEEAARKPVKPSKIVINPLTDAQADYDSAMQSSIITFGVGPAGTGKTWLAAARAAEAIRDGKIEKIIITRPAVEAGENMGFLPGELNEKFEPYFRPVRDALEEVLGSGHLEYLIKMGSIEARPLAYLRGASFKNSTILLDEAQNTTPKQMELFLTRIGKNCRVVINGDLKQSDLGAGSRSGLADAIYRLRNLKTVRVIRFGKSDIVRSGICQDIVNCYDDETVESFTKNLQLV